MVIGKAGAVTLDADLEFSDRIFKELGLRNVPSIIQKYRDRKYIFDKQEVDFNGVMIPATVCKVLDDDEMNTEGLPAYPSQEEQDEYYRLKNEYIAERVLAECSWADFLQRCKWDGLSKEFIRRHHPCEAPSGNCSMFCPDGQKGACPYK